MSHRNFEDEKGRKWAVWLCFEAEGEEKRRLVPVPEAWESASDDDLRRWCRLAKRVVRCEVE